MGNHGKDYTKDYTGRDDAVSRRDYGTGSLFQRCEARFGCPPMVKGPPHPDTGEPTKVRPDHECRGRWFGSLQGGFTANGTRKRITVSAKTKAEAKRKLRDKRLELEREGRRNVKRTITVAKWSVDWLAAIKPHVRPNAFATDKAAVKAIVAAIGSVKLADLSPADVRAVAKYLRAHGRSSSTALRYQGSLMRMLTAAALDGYSIPPNVLLTEKANKAVNDRDAVPVEQAIRVLGHLGALPASHELARRGSVSRWALTFLQGHRISESLGLTWPEVDLEAETLRISWQLQTLKYVDRGDPDAGFEIPDGYEVRHLVGAYHLVRPKSIAGWRVQPLVPWAARALRAWREIAPDNPHDLVWPGRVAKGKVWPRNKPGDRAEWAAIQKAVDIAHPDGRPWDVHEIRHGTATLLLALDVPESVRIAIMGHSTVASTKVYEHVDLTQARAALERMAERLQLD